MKRQFAKRAVESTFGLRFAGAFLVILSLGIPMANPAVAQTTVTIGANEGGYILANSGDYLRHSFDVSFGYQPFIRSEYRGTVFFDLPVFPPDAVVTDVKLALNPYKYDWIPGDVTLSINRISSAFVPYDAYSVERWNDIGDGPYTTIVLTHEDGSMAVGPLSLGEEAVAEFTARMPDRRFQLGFSGDAGGYGGAVAREMSLHVTYVRNAAPVARNDTFSMAEGRTLTGNVLDSNGAGADSDPTGDPLNVSAVPIVDVRNGTLVLHADGSFTYEPTIGFVGEDSFVYRLNDEYPRNVQATVTINVRSVNDAPTFSKGPDVTVAEDGGSYTSAGWATDISAGPTDEAGQSLTFEITTTNDALFSEVPVLAENGELTFASAPNANGVVTVTVVLRDDGGTADGGVDESAPQTFTITITPINDAPSFVKGADVAVLEDAGAQTIPGWATSINPGPANEAAQALTFVLTTTNDALFSSPPAIDVETGTLTFTPAADANGEATVTVVLGDDGGMANGGMDESGQQTFTITVAPINDAPSFTKGPDRTQLEDAPAGSYTGWATGMSPGPADESGQALLFSLTTDNDALFAALPSIDPVTGTLSYLIAPNANGRATVTVVLEDDGGTANGGLDENAPRTFTITVTPVNDVPSFIKGADETVLEDAGAVTVTGWATAISPGPANEAAQGLTFTLMTTNDALFSVHPAIDPATGTLTYTPAADANGAATVTVALADDGGTADGGVDESGAQTFTISVTSVNDVPFFAKGPDLTLLEDAGSQNVVGWATTIGSGPVDEAGQAMTFQLTTDNDALFSTLPSIDPATGTLLYSAAADAYGLATVTVVVKDDGGTADGGADESAQQTFTITVTPVNDAPSFIGGADQSILEDAGTQAVIGWATGISPGPSNEMAQVLTFSLSTTNDALFSIPPAIDAATGALTYTPAVDANGAAIVTVVLHDDGGTADGGVFESAPRSFRITVASVNDAPTFTRGVDLVLVEDDGPQNIPAWASPISSGPGDEEGQARVFEVTATNSWLFATLPAIDPLSGTLTFSPAPGVSGTSSVTVQVVDFGGTTSGGEDRSAPETFQITILPVNDPPTFMMGADQTVDEDGGPQEIPGWATAISPGSDDEVGQRLTFVVTTTGAALFASAPSIDVTTGTLRYTPAADASGAATVTVLLTDDGGVANGGLDTSAARTFTITVSAVNDAPRLVLPGPQSTANDAPIVFSVLMGTGIAVVDPDIGTLPMELTVTAGSTATLAAGHALSVTSGADGTSSVTARGTLADINAALDGLTYTPSHDGASSLTILVSDLGGSGSGGAKSATGTVAITNQAAPANRPPTARNDGALVYAGESVLIEVLANDSDPDGDVLQVTNVDGPAAGSATLQPDGSILFVPAGTNEEEVIFRYSIVDGRGGVSSARVTVQVVTAGPDKDGVPDSIEDGAANNGDGNGDGVPDSGQTNVASFPIATGSNTGKYLTVLVDGGSHLERVQSLPSNPSPADFPGTKAPSVGFLSFELHGMEPGGQRTVLIYLPPGVKATDYLKYGPTPENTTPHWYSFTFDGTTGAQFVRETPTATGRIILYFQDGARGDDDLTANGVIKDPGVPVFDLNATPVIGADHIEVSEDGFVVFDPLANDVEGSAGALILVSVGEPAHGTATIAPDGSVRYTPVPDFAGGDTFTYVVSDGVSDSMVGTVTITVTAVNDPPVFRQSPPYDQVVLEGETVTIDFAASDPDGETLVYTAVQVPEGASVDPSTGTVTWTATAYGTTPIQVSASDGTTAVLSPIVRIRALAVDRYSVHLAGVHQRPGVETPGSGSGEVRVIEARGELALSIEVENLSSPFTGAYLEIGHVGEVSLPVMVVLPAEVSAGGRVVRFDGTMQLAGAELPVPELVGRMRTGGVSLRVATEAHPDGEVRGQILSTSNRPPVVGSITTPGELDASKGGLSLTVGLGEATDPDRDRILYIVQLGSDAGFSHILSARDRTEPGELAWSAADVLQLLANAKADETDELSPSPTLYVRAVVSDGSLWSVSAVQKIVVRTGTATGSERNGLPTEYYLGPNYPNPFNPSTTLVFGLPEAAHVRVDLYDVQGRLVRTVVDEMRPAGAYEETVRMDDLPTGMYLYRFTTGTRTFSRTMHLVK